MYKNVIKFGLSAVALFGVDEIVSNAIRHVNPQNMNTAKKICIGVASLAISGCVADKINAYIDDTVDKVFDALEDLVAKKDEIEEEEG